MILTLTDFIAAQETKNGKMAPAKAKGHDGKTYALGRDVDAALILSAVASGHPLEVEVSSKQTTVNGKQYTNHYLNSAKRLPAASAEPSSSLGETAGRPAEAPAVSKPLPIANPDDYRQRLIVRQTALKAAAELVANDPAIPAEERFNAIAYLTEKFVGLVFQEGSAYDLDAEKVNRSGEDRPHGGDDVTPPLTPAHQHLAEARAKAKSITDSYDDADAVCPNCGRKEFLKQYSGGWFCARSKVAGEPGGCGYPNKGERLDSPVTWGEFKERTAVRRPDAQVVGPSTYPSRSR